MPRAPARILVTTRLFDAAAESLLAAGGCTVVYPDRPPDALGADLPDAELHALLAGAQGWIVGVRAVTRARPIPILR